MFESPDYDGVSPIGDLPEK